MLPSHFATLHKKQYYEQEIMHSSSFKTQSLWFDFNLHYTFWSYFWQSSDTTFKTSWVRRKHPVLHWPAQSKHTPFVLTFLQTHVGKIRSTLWYQQCYNLSHPHKVLIQVLFIFAQFRPLLKNCSKMSKHERQLQRQELPLWTYF